MPLHSHKVYMQLSNMLLVRNGDYMIRLYHDLDNGIKTLPEDNQGIINWESQTENGLVVTNTMVLSGPVIN